MITLDCLLSSDEAEQLRLQEIEVPKSLTLSFLKETLTDLGKIHQEIHQEGERKKNSLKEKNIQEQKIQEKRVKIEEAQKKFANNEKQELISYVYLIAVGVFLGAGYAFITGLCPPLAAALFIYCVLGGLLSLRAEKIHRNHEEFEQSIKNPEEQKTVATSRKLFMGLGAMFAPLLFPIMACTIDRGLKKRIQEAKALEQKIESIDGEVEEKQEVEEKKEVEAQQKALKDLYQSQVPSDILEFYQQNPEVVRKVSDNVSSSKLKPRLIDRLHAILDAGKNLANKETPQFFSTGQRGEKGLVEVLFPRLEIGFYS